MIRQSETDPSFEEYENDLFELNVSVVNFYKSRSSVSTEGCP